MGSVLCQVVMNSCCVGVIVLTIKDHVADYRTNEIPIAQETCMKRIL